MKLSLTSKILFAPLIGFFLFLIGREVAIYAFSDESPYLDALVDARTSEVKCLIMGDSQTAALFRHEIKECDNLAVGGASIHMIEDVVESVMEKNELELVILGIGPHYFSENRLQNRSDDFEGIAEFYTPEVSLLGNRSTVNFNIFNFIKAKLKKPKIENGEDDLESDWPSKSFEEREEKILQRVAQHRPVQDWRQSDFAQRYLDMLKLLQDKGVKVCVVRAPVDESYESKLFQSFSLSDWLEYLEQIKDLQAKYLEYSSFSADVYPLEGLRNQDHIHPSFLKRISRLYFDSCIRE